MTIILYPFTGHVPKLKRYTDIQDRLDSISTRMYKVVGLEMQQN